MANRIFGYARVSSNSQNLERQRIQLREYVPDPKNIIEEKASGKDFTNRPKYMELVHSQSGLGLREGDLLIICSLDRLGRNYAEIRQEWEYITNTIKADIKVLDMPLLDTSKSNKDLNGRFIADLVLQILSYTAEKERENTAKRRDQGNKAMPINEKGKRVSLKTGRPTGRPEAEKPANWNEVYNKWKSGAITAGQAMQELNLKRTTFYKLVKAFETEKQAHTEKPAQS